MFKVGHREQILTNNFFIVTLQFQSFFLIIDEENIHHILYQYLYPWPARKFFIMPFFVTYFPRYAKVRHYCSMSFLCSVPGFQFADEEHITVTCNAS